MRHIKLVWQVLMVLMLVSVFVCGCRRTTALERDYGRSVTHNMMMQYVNPTAGQDPRPALGLNAGASQNTIGRYEKSFKEKDPPSTIIQVFR